MAGGRYEYVFDAQPQEVATPWFALFQSVSAFSNTGMSLADQSMIPFQAAYLMVASKYWVERYWYNELICVVVVILIFAGNTAYVSRALDSRAWKGSDADLSSLSCEL
jgi:Trk-type K+ transport system membrane component